MHDSLIAHARLLERWAGAGTDPRAGLKAAWLLGGRLQQQEAGQALPIRRRQAGGIIMMAKHAFAQHLLPLGLKAALYPLQCQLQGSWALGATRSKHLHEPQKGAEMRAHTVTSFEKQVEATVARAMGKAQLVQGPLRGHSSSLE